MLPRQELLFTQSRIILTAALEGDPGRCRYLYVTGQKTNKKVDLESETLRSNPKCVT